MESSRFQGGMAALALSASVLAAAAEPPGHSGANPSSFDCQSLATGPDAARAVEQCKADMSGMGDLMKAMNQPGGERPGDDRLSCDQIVAELRTVSGPGVSAKNRAESLAAGKQLQDTYNAQMAKGQTMAAAQTARSAAAAGIDIATGTNLAGAGATAQNTAEQAVLQADATAQVDAARARAAAAGANARGDLAASLRTNPRMGRLMQLVMAKNCPTPQ